MWTDDQKFEAEWWGSCCNTLGEEEKQLVYARKMGLKLFHNGKSPYNIDMQGKSVLDIGGGPVSLLLKCENVVGLVVDPCKFPDWVIERYVEAKITFQTGKGEDIGLEDFDEVWIYNVLQHVDDPEKVVANALRAGKIVRVFEWIDNGVSIGHPHNLTEDLLNKWLGGVGKVEGLDLTNLKGRAYFGIFKGNNYV